VKKGYKVGDKTYKVYLDGFNLMPFLAGKEEKSPRPGFIYWSDDGDCMAMRIGRFKVVFAEQRNTGFEVWREPLSAMRVPKFFDLCADPFERGEEGIGYNNWFLQNAPLMYAAPPILMQWLSSFKEFPPRAKSASFTIDQAVEKMMPKSRSSRTSSKCKPAFDRTSKPGDSERVDQDPIPISPDESLPISKGDFSI
jgi:hypothetical protein